MGDANDHDDKGDVIDHDDEGDVEDANDAVKGDVENADPPAADQTWSPRQGSNP